MGKSTKGSRVKGGGNSEGDDRKGREVKKTSKKRKLRDMEEGGKKGREGELPWRQKHATTALDMSRTLHRPYCVKSEV
jgi:hypothetical protein